MRPLAYLFAFLSLILSGAMFGFFYAWVCSTMWGLDAAPPAVAIQAMQAMNASVRNAVFAPAFFGTPIALLVAAGLAFALGLRVSGAAFVLGAVVYGLGVFVVTMTVSVPMNQALAAVDVAAAADKAGAIWQEYSGPWQAWNTGRAVAAGVVMVLTGLGLQGMRRVTE
jgi:uncharacterized membrane protein